LTTNLIAMLTRPLKEEDIEKLLNYKGMEHNFSIPLIFMPIGVFSVSFGPPTPLTIGKLVGANLQVHNAAFTKDQRGVIQLSLMDEPKPDVTKYLDALSTLLSSTRLDADLFAYELYHNTVRQGTLKKFRPSIPTDLKGMKDPYLFEFNIYQGDLRGGDVRLLPFEQISVQPATSDPSRVSITLVYRVRPDEKEVLLVAFDDLEKVLSLTVEVQKNEQRTLP